MPTDRPIDGVDQSDFLLGKTEASARQGFPVLVADRLEAVKWRNWKVVFYDEERDWWTPPVKLGEPKMFDLITDPKEEYPATGIRNTWVAGLALKIVSDFEQSLKRHPPIAESRTARNGGRRFAFPPYTSRTYAGDSTWITRLAIMSRVFAA